MTQLLAAGVAAAALGACASAHTVEMQGRGIASGANAELKLASTDSGNNELRLTVQHLLPPERIDTRYDRYSVWVEPAGEPIRLAGRLVYDAEDRTGHFSTVTPYEDVHVIVTAESSRQPQRPRGTTVFSETISSS